MKANTRVAVNAAATYGRTLLRMALGLFTSRWVLESLGEVDYGLMGVVGSLIVFITFLNGVFSGACARFFAFSIGKKNLDDLISWFNIGLSVHLVLAVALVVIGYPLGEWAIDNWLNIPPDRVETARWVFRFSLIAAFWTMVSTPYMAMYTATQNIAELTLWEVASILTNFGFVYWLTTYQGNTWLVYAGFTVGISVLLGIGKVLRAQYQFPGCKIRFAYWGDWQRTKQMFSFSGWTLFGNLGYMARSQFPSVLLNKFFPPLLFPFVNASYQVGGALSGYTNSMSSSLLGAFSPQITTLAGAGDRQGMIITAFRASKFGSILMLLFAIPVALEADYLLVLWLKNPPLLASAFCRIALIQLILDILTFGQMTGIIASGKIKWYQLSTGLLCVLSVPLAWIMLKMGGGPLMVSWAVAVCMGACSTTRLFFGRAILGMGINDWVKKVLLPVLSIILASAVSGSIVMFLITTPSFLRLCLTSAVSCGTVICLTWYLLLESSEKNKIRQIIRRFRNRFKSPVCV